MGLQRAPRSTAFSCGSRTSPSRGDRLRWFRFSGSASLARRPRRSIRYARTRRLGARDHKTGSAFRFEIAARPISRGSVWSRFADCTELITQKLAGQERLAIDLLHDSHAARIIASARDALTRAETIPAIRLLESQAALAYWSAWRAVPVMYPKSDLRRVPDHWRTSGPRSAEKRADAAPAFQAADPPLAALP
jgi:hypothetical protein